MKKLPGSVATLACQVEHATGSVEKLVMMHGLETSDHPGVVLDEAARVLAPGGRVLFIVPARAGLWARRDGTPFGFGRPYTMAQLEAQLKRHAFSPERSMAALFTPPSKGRFWLRTADFWEGVGRRLGTSLAGGVLMVEATKHVRAPTRGGLAAAVRKPLKVLEGVGQPAPQPARSPAV